MTRRRRLLVLGGLAVLVIAASTGLWLGRAKQVAWDVRGVSMPVWSVDGLHGSGPALEQLAASGANTVTLVVTWYMPHPASNEIRRTQATASDESLVWALKRAQELNLRVLLKPMVDVEDQSWRAYIKPDDSNTWFATYAAMINHYADMAAQHNAWGLVVGNELVSMSTNKDHEQRWRDIIADVRERFEGKLTYGANWGGTASVQEFTQIPFWDALDYLGIAAYFELSEHAQPSKDEMRQQWVRWQQDLIAPFQQRHNKPVLFTEIGYRSLDGAASEPWNAARDGQVDLQEQMDCYEVAFEAWADVPWFAGMLFWNWNPSSAVSPRDTGYEIQNKPALATLARWYGGTGTVNGAVPAAVKIYSPQSNATASGTVNIEAFATQALSVTYSVGDRAPVAMALDRDAQVWRAALNTMDLPNGKHTVSVTAWPRNGEAVVDQAWNIAVTNEASGALTSSASAAPATTSGTDAAFSPPAAFSVRISNPLSDQTYAGTITVRAAAPGAAAVVYQVDEGEAVAMTRNTGDNVWEAVLDTTSLTNGQHQVTVTARAADNASATDRAWNINIAND